MDMDCKKGLRKFHPGMPKITASRGKTRVPGIDQGKDTVPAMLRPGEAVLVPEAADEIGRDTIAALNQKHAPGAPVNGEMKGLRLHAFGGAASAGELLSGSVRPEFGLADEEFMRARQVAQQASLNGGVTPRPPQRPVPSQAVLTENAKNAQAAISRMAEAGAKVPVGPKPVAKPMISPTGAARMTNALGLASMAAVPLKSYADNMEVEKGGLADQATQGLRGMFGPEMRDRLTVAGLLPAAPRYKAEGAEGTSSPFQKDPDGSTFNVVDRNKAIMNGEMTGPSTGPIGLRQEGFDMANMSAATRTKLEDAMGRSNEATMNDDAKVLQAATTGAVPGASERQRQDAFNQAAPTRREGLSGQPVVDFKGGLDATKYDVQPGTGVITGPAAKGGLRNTSYFGAVDPARQAADDAKAKAALDDIVAKGNAAEQRMNERAQANSGPSQLDIMQANEQAAKDAEWKGQLAKNERARADRAFHNSMVGAPLAVQHNMVSARNASLAADSQRYSADQHSADAAAGRQVAMRGQDLDAQAANVRAAAGLRAAMLSRQPTALDIAKYNHELQKTANLQGNADREFQAKKDDKLDQFLKDNATGGDGKVNNERLSFLRQYASNFAKDYKGNANDFFSELQANLEVDNMFENQGRHVFGIEGAAGPEAVGLRQPIEQNRSGLQAILHGRMPGQQNYRDPRTGRRVYDADVAELSPRARDILTERLNLRSK